MFNNFAPKKAPKAFIFMALDFPFIQVFGIPEYLALGKQGLCTEKPFFSSLLSQLFFSMLYYVLIASQDNIMTSTGKKRLSVIALSLSLATKVEETTLRRKKKTLCHAS